ncbi:hypothetical protein DVH24_012588 [Malus domestica]|uniref:Uncharacterized protein n=1 Tax=Malus domestica TaxID=3750 RepID=A0A498HRJ2_MALDO|nr:hypothetical protein DVH24_012588 [Malus domestica]
MPGDFKVPRDGTRWDGMGRNRTERIMRTKRGTERLVPFRPVSSHVPNGTLWNVEKKQKHLPNYLKNYTDRPHSYCSLAPLYRKEKQLKS